MSKLALLAATLLGAVARLAGSLRDAPLLP